MPDAHAAPELHSPSERPAIVQTVMARELQDLRVLRDATVEADLVELRLDGLDRPDVRGALAGRTRPVIVTCRASWEGGHFRGSEEARVNLLREALASDAEFVDIEWRAEAARALITDEVRHRVVLSMHDFERTPPDLGSQVEAMRAIGTGVVKVAARTRRLAELRPLLAIGRSPARAGQSTVVIGMGTAGLPSRALPAHFGSRWTYGGPAIAPGQVPVERLVHEFRVRDVRADTPVYAVVGRPIVHSVSPAMHNAAFAATGAPGVYVPCEAAEFDDFLALADVLPIVGASVTAPFKEAAWEAQASNAAEGGRGALNTLSRLANGSWRGLNTDIEGFLAPLADVTLAERRVAVLGAGGAARAVVTGLVSRGAQVSVHARRAEAAARLASEMGVQSGAWPPTPGAWDVLVNTTPVGTFPDVDASPMSGTELTGALVYDLIYNPRATRLLREARAAGLTAIDGLTMLVEQARRQFAWWTGILPDAHVLRQAAEARLDAMASEDAPAREESR